MRDPQTIENKNTEKPQIKLYINHSDDIHEFKYFS